MALTKSERAQSLIDPSQFQSVYLRRKLWNGQRRICQAVATKRHVAVKACHASGKTFNASGLVLWWLQRHPRGKVINVAPTLRQVKLMWEEIELARQQSRIAFPQCTTTGLKISEDRYAIGMSSSRGVNVQGFHGEAVLIIADEAPGIDAEIWDAIEGIRAGGQVTLLELGNPTIPSGHFFENFGRGRSSCECITISAFDTPNFAGVTLDQLATMTPDELAVNPAKYLVSRVWVRDRLNRWGATHPMFRARVLGEFPTQSSDSVFSLEWIEAAARPVDETDWAMLGRPGMPVPEIRVGIDVAGPGEDETVACARVGGVILDIQAWSDADPRGKLSIWLSRFRTDRRFKLGTVMVDTVGMGYYLAKHLADNGFAVAGFNAGGSALNQESFVNAKAEGYWAAREWFERKAIRGLADEETQAQLSGIRYEHTASGRVQIESKDDARKRGVSSPDRAEALILSFVPVVQRSGELVADYSEELISKW